MFTDQHNTSSPHSHISTLGLENLEPTDAKDAVLGQKNARKAAGIVIHMLRTNKMSGRAVLLLGPSTCGKTALAMAMSKEILSNFVHLSGCELSVESLMMHVRRAIRIKLRELKKIYEGEITSIRLKNFQFKIDLKSCKGSTTVKIGKSMYESVRDEELSIGDVVYIEPMCGIVKKIGRSENAFEYDIECGRKVPLPKKDVLRRKIVTQVLSLHDIDVAEETSDQLKNTMRHMLGKNGVKLSTMQDTNEIVNAYVENGMGEVQPGILFIDECHLLSKRVLFQIIKVIEDDLSPLVLLATNNKQFLEREDAQDLFNRLFVIKMEKDPSIIPDILKMRADKCRLSLHESAFCKLAAIGRERGLRRALNLLSLMKETDKEVTENDVRVLDELYD